MTLQIIQMSPQKYRKAETKRGNKLVLVALLVFVACLGFTVGLLHARFRARLALHTRREETEAVQLAYGEQKAKSKASDSAVVQKKENDVCAAPNASGKEGVEYWGALAPSPLYPDSRFIAQDAQECCRMCESSKGCNTWVWCNDVLSCGGACWLKRHGDPMKPEVHAEGPEVKWTSGTLMKDADVNPAKMPQDASISAIQLTTKHGVIRIQLEPTWSEESVAYVRRLAAKPELCTHACAFYRAEPGFLLQGSLRAYMPANTQLKPGPRLMERGDIGWAGGMGGPDWFIYLGAQPAAHFGTSHTVWGRVVDPASFDIIEQLVQLPARAPPGGMHMLDEQISFEVSVAA